MSISSTMSSALSGLTVAARSAELISSNIANALTEGYARRELQVSARQIGNAGQGVQVDGVQRQINQVLLADRRIADAGLADRDARAAYLQRLDRAIGSPDSAQSLVGRVATFDAALIAAASQPQSEARLSSLANAAQSLVETFNRSGAEIQDARRNAEVRIAADVNEINRALSSIAELNGQIVSLTSNGRDHSALEDQRQQLIDRIAPILPLRELPRENGRVALYTLGGMALLDGRAGTLAFNPVGVITPDMSFGSGALSGLTLNGRPVGTGATSGLAGGALAAQFEIRDVLAPQAQTDLDAMTRDLITRFSDPALDPSLTTAMAGLFTDNGAAFDSVNELGLAQRLKVNDAVIPEKGGALWRLRDGIGATSPGPVGQSDLLDAMQRVLTAPRVPASGSFGTAARSFSSMTAQYSSRIATDRLEAETEASFAAARQTTLRGLELEQGVDTDRELQDLLLVEQAYAANAKVVQTVDDMIKLLLGL